MFCTRCGKEIQEGWIHCPNCGAVVQNQEGGKQSRQSADSRSRDEIKAELLNKAFSGKGGGVVLFEGANGISKDMEKILYPEEQVICLYSAYRIFFIGSLKSGRNFRTYIVCTEQRFIYMETGRWFLSMLSFLKKTISIPYNEIINVSAYTRLGIYSGRLNLEIINGKIGFATTDERSAIELREFIINKKRA